MVSKIINRGFLMKMLKSQFCYRRHTPPNVAVLHLLVCCGPMFIYISGPGLDFKILFFFLIMGGAVSHCFTGPCG